MAEVLKVAPKLCPPPGTAPKDTGRNETAIQAAPVGNTAVGRTILITYPEVATVAQKQQLAKSYGAHAVDMDAAAIARAAQTHNLPFIAVKAISADVNFKIPEMSTFIRAGQFDTIRFALHI